MIRFIVRRLIQMIPIMFGVILITFILFNLVGGSPGRIILGDKASARDLEAFDEQRGFNRPLFWGRHSSTRIYQATELERSPGPWTTVSNVVWSSGEGVLIRGPARVTIPLAFKPAPGQVFSWELQYRLVGNASIQSAEQIYRLGDTPGSTLSWRAPVNEPSSSPIIEMEADGEMLVEGLICRRWNDQPWKSQWLYYLGQLIRLDFGRSHTSNQAVVDLLRQGIGPTLMLATPILIGELVVSLVLALGCAYFRNRWFDRLILVVCVMLMSVNYLVWIVAGQYWLAYRLNLFPVWGFESWSYVLLPVLIGILHGLGPNVRFYRAVMLEEMHKDYVRTAWAKGLGPTRILFVHVLKNAMIPVITNVALSLPFLYTGSLLLETFFGIPGLGYLSINAINSSDVDVVRAVVLIGSFLYLLSNLLADLAYAWVDPRVRFS